MMNICTYIRGGADFAYDIFLVTTHVVTTMMAVMCACIFIGPVHICALKNFPVIHIYINHYFTNIL